MHRYHQGYISRVRVLGTLIMTVLACLALPLQAAPGGVAKTVRGELDIAIEDDFKNKRAQTRHHVKDRATGQYYRLEFRGKPPQGLKQGQKVKVRGRARNGRITVDELTQDGTGDAGNGASGGDAAATAVRRAVLILVDFRDAQHANGRFADPLALTRQQMYTSARSVNNMYQAASLGRLGFDPDVDGDGAPDVFGPYQIDHDYADSSCSYYNWSSAAEAAAAADGVDLSAYQHKVFVLPYYGDFSFGCGWAGVANTSCSTSCRAWTAEPQSGMVLAHELGHNLNLAHAGTDPENDGVVNSIYGDTSDPMGISRHWMTFNAPHTAELGWFDGAHSEVRNVSSSGHFSLRPLDDAAAGGAGLRALRLPRDSSSDYYISLRRKLGTFDGLGAVYDNVINIHSHSTASSYQKTLYITGLAAGGTFEDPATGLTVTSLGDQGDGTFGVEVAYAAADCVPAAPSVALTPASAVARDGGDSVTYTMTVTNNDSGACAPVAYDLATSPDSAMNGVVSDSLASGQSWTGYFDLACAADGCANLGLAAGGNPVNVNAAGGDGRNRSAQAQFIRDNVAPTVPSGLSASINRKGRASVSWAASSDTLSSVAHYRVRVNGGAVVTVGGTSYSYDNASTGDVITVAAVDQPGNVSSTASVTASGSTKGGGKSGGGGDKPCRGKKCS